MQRIVWEGRLLDRDAPKFASQWIAATNVDVAEVSVRLSTLQTQLEAAYSAIGTIQSLSLVDYLR